MRPERNYSEKQEDPFSDWDCLQKMSRDFVKFLNFKIIIRSKC